MKINIIEYKDSYSKEVINHISNIAINEFKYDDWEDYFDKIVFDEYKKDGSKFWIALNDKNEVIGTIGALRISLDEVDLNNLYVNKNYREFGIAKHLYNLFYNFIKQQKYKTITLRTLFKFKNAIEFYEKLGFTKYNKDNESYFYRKNTNPPKPDVEEVQKYLEKWQILENYTLQEEALNKLFLETYPCNTDINDILIKASSLNDFYSTNIFSIFTISKHILELNIDGRLKTGDISLIKDIANVQIKNKNKEFYSFATKYCSHHNPLKFPIFDSYVEEVLKYYRKKDQFFKFKNDDLREYPLFKEILKKFRNYYELEEYNLKQLDQYLWLLGKDYMPKNYMKFKNKDGVYTFKTV